MNVLVINAGSSSLKYQLINVETHTLMAKGICERVGSAEAFHKHGLDDNEVVIDAKMADHDDAMALVLESLVSGQDAAIASLSEIDAVGHRIVQGGKYFDRSVLIDDDVIAKIDELAELAPLHNGAALMGIHACMKHMPGIPMVAVFDTSFFTTLPPKAYMYPLPYELYEKYAIRKYGAHGTSHRYISERAAVVLDEPLEDLKLITLHLGNGCSASAIDHGVAVDTSMGLTPLDGLMMGTRCGDIDPSVVNYLKYTLNITGHQLDEILNKKSGLLGVSGVSSDKRDVEAAAAAGNPRAQLASDMLNYQIKKTSGSYIAAMGGVDAIVFTGGIGEHDADSRAKICHHMDWLGIRVDTDKNANAHKQNKDVVEITAWGAKVRTLVIETNEELMIARDTKEVLGNEGLL